MKILVIDHFFHKRDCAQTDMYQVLAQHYDVTFVTSEIFPHIFKANYDYLYLGIYHQHLDVDWEQIFWLNRKPVIIDQADNEEFVDKYNYSLIPNKTVLSRYLPHPVLYDLCARTGTKVKLLKWYVNPKRFFTSVEKTCDVAFICSMHGTRNYIRQNVVNVCNKNGWTYVVGEFFGSQYTDVLSKSRVFIAECSRRCVTQKYIEAMLSHAVIVGDVPKYPDNNMRVIEANLLDGVSLEKGITEALASTGAHPLTPFCNEEVLIETYKQIFL